MKPLIVGNWKMNPEHAKLAKNLFSDISKKIKNYNASIVFCPPSIYLGILSSQKVKGDVSLGAQNIASLPDAAQTGEISAQMVRNLGAKYVIIGHSERRAIGESGEMVNQKIKMAIKNSLVPIVCFGERVRDINHNYLRGLELDIKIAFTGIPSTALKKFVIAYEPVWAIGVNAIKEETPVDCTEMIIFIKRVLSDIYGKKFIEPRFIYGGSVHPENAEDFMEKGNVTGLLVGRDSVNTKKFLKILESMNNLK